MDRGKFSENELRILLFDYVIRNKQENGTMPTDPIAIKTISISDVIDDLAREHGVQVLTVLPEPSILNGLKKYIDVNRCIFGFGEELCPIIGNTIQNNQLVQDMKRYYKCQKKSLDDTLEELYNKYGHFKEEIIQLPYENEERVDYLMGIFQQYPPHTFGGYEVVKKKDRVNICNEYIYNDLYISDPNVLEYMLKNGARVIIRKNKLDSRFCLYFFARGTSEDMVTHVISNLKSYMVSLNNYSIVN